MVDIKKNKKLIESLKQSGFIKSKKVENAFSMIFRENFVPLQLKNFAYIDRPFEIGEGQTISAPHMVAIMVEALDIKPGNTVLEIGSGSGYHAAIVSLLVGANGFIYSIERIHNLVEIAKKNLQKSYIKNVIILEGDGSIGLPEHEPYDRIYVTCASPSIPQPLLDQLSKNGKLLIPIGRKYCELKLVEKKDDHTVIKDLGCCAFVPLIGKYGF